MEGRKVGGEGCLRRDREGGRGGKDRSEKRRVENGRVEERTERGKERDTEDERIRDKEMQERSNTGKEEQRK